MMWMCEGRGLQTEEITSAETRECQNCLRNSEKEGHYGRSSEQVCGEWGQG